MFVFAALMFPAMLAAGQAREYSLAFVSIMLHEAGHFAAAKMRGINMAFVKITPAGFSAAIQFSDLPRRVLLEIYIAGPAANFMLSGLAMLGRTVFPGLDNFFKLVAATNLLLGAFNLLPAFPLDGGRILMEFLSGRLGILAAGKLVRGMAWCLLTAMLLAGAYQIYIGVYNASMLAVGVYILITLRSGRMESAFMNIRQILYRRSKLLKRGIYAARGLAVLKSARLAEALKSMDFDRFHVLFVLDEDLKIIKIITEDEVMNALSSFDESITFGQLIKLHESGGNTTNETGCMRPEGS
ncbi:MAG: site-2 protease family protein [Bacillota bacterium]